jgi:hypothetical protein
MRHLQFKVEEKSMTSLERRHFPRFPFHRSAVLIFSTGQFEVALIDLAANGALVESIGAPGFSLYERCELRVLNSEGLRVLAVDAIIVHCIKSRYVGLRLCNISSVAEKDLRQIVEMNLGRDELIQRDFDELLKIFRDSQHSPAVENR